MELEKVRDFFESFYSCIHKLDVENYDPIFLKNIMACIEEKFAFIAEHFCENGVLKSDFSGRVLFVYQNSSSFCRLLLLHGLNKGISDSARYADMGFLNFDIENVYRSDLENNEAIRKRIKEKSEISLHFPWEN